MLRFLLSVLALVSGLAVPGTVAARDLGPSGTAIGALAEAAQTTTAEVPNAARILARPATPRERGFVIVRPSLAAFTVPVPTVILGSDRALE